MRHSEYCEEKISQRPAIEILKSLGYVYIHPQEAEQMRGGRNHVLLKDILREQLASLNSFEYKGCTYEFSSGNIEQAIRDLDEPLVEGLVSANEKIYDSLMLGRSYPESLPDGGIYSFSLKYIDWESIDNNVFHVVEEFSVEREDGKGTNRPDIVLFVNGIPFAVIECKRSSIGINQGIEQTIGYQNKEAIPHLYKFCQLVMATNKNDTKYATCATPKKFWAEWHEEYQDWLEGLLNKHVAGRMPTKQDKNIISLFSPERLLEITRYFTLFDVKVKKIARYQQYFAVQEIIKSIKTFDKKGNRMGGVIWHTQGSGKSLTMVMLARYILSDNDFTNPRVVVVTDRVYLDKQIRDTFAHTRLRPIRATSGANLVKLIEEGSADIITTLVHKFDAAAKKNTKLESRDLFVLVDESHRTQYGELHIKLKQVFPNACYLGFTGTPLMKKDKNTMIKFGQSPRPIHAYTIADGVRDKVIVPLLYEGKMVEQTVNQKAIDQRLDMITRHLNEKQTEEVKQKWSQFERIASSKQRIYLIAFDINEHFVMNYKTAGSQFKAMLATNSKKEAIHYLEVLEELADLNVAVVISPPDSREGYDAVDEEANNLVRKYWDRVMTRYGNEEDYEQSLKEDFVHGELDLIIVVDKLLTGFDAPKATVLYIDKQMREHTLLQAIARVNRLYEGKDFGYIVDYRGLLEQLDEAMNMYSGAGLEEFDPEDLKGALYDVKSTIGELRQAHSQVKDIFISVQNKRDVEEYEVLLGDEELRENFYDSLSYFARKLNIALESEEIYLAIGREELEKCKQDLRFFQELRKSVKLRYSDGIDHKEYEAKMQNLMDTYISAEEVVRVTNPVDIMDEKGFQAELDRLGSPRAKADAIRTRLSKRIDKRWEEHPVFYKKFSERIKEVLDAYKEKRISEAEYLGKMREILTDFRGMDLGIAYPDSIRKNENAKAFYGVVREMLESNQYMIGKEETVAKLALGIDEVVDSNVKVDWQNNSEVHKRIEQELDDLLFDFGKEHEAELTLDQIDQVIEHVKMIAIRRYR